MTELLDILKGRSEVLTLAVLTCGMVMYFVLQVLKLKSQKTDAAPVAVPEPRLYHMEKVLEKCESMFERQTEVLQGMLLELTVLHKEIADIKQSQKKVEEILDKATSE